MHICYNTLDKMHRVVQEIVIVGRRTGIVIKTYGIKMQFFKRIMLFQDSKT